MEQKEEYLQLSGLQHFSFCRRQWALIHLENQWNENLRTVEGSLFHSRAHNDGVRALVKGVMVESYLVEGAQKISDHMVRGQSITDPCRGWEDTEKLLCMIADRV